MNLAIRLQYPLSYVTLMLSISLLPSFGGIPRLLTSQTFEQRIEHLRSMRANIKQMEKTLQRSRLLLDQAEARMERDHPSWEERLREAAGREPTPINCKCRISGD